jgi:hypothetical protein
MRDRVWLTRLRWRLRGATMWPAFVLAVVLDAVLLRALPIAGDTAPDVFAAVLLAFFFNLVVVAVGAPLFGRFLGRRRGLPKVVADDRAGTVLIGALAVALLAIGLVHHPALRAEGREFDEQADLAREYVLARAPARFRSHVDQMDTWKQGPDLYRTCTPGPDPGRHFCVIVDTRLRPPHVIRDRDQTPNVVLAGPDNPGRKVR